MAMILRQSTASQEILLGPFVDSTDGNTAETALTIANTDIKIFKEGATTLADKNSGGATHISNGYYYAVLDATDTNTVGQLEVNVKVSGALAVRREFQVVEEAVYDALFAASAAGYQVPIWASASSTVNLSGTTVKAVTDRVTANTDQWNGTAVTSATVRSDLINIAGVAVSTSTAQLGVNVVNFGGSAGTFSSGRPEVNTTHIGGSTTPVTNIGTVFNTDFATNYNTTIDMWNVNVENWNTTAVPAEHTAGYPIVTIKDGTGTGEINTNAGAIALVDLVTTTTTATNVTTVNGLAAGVITAAAIATNAIDADALAADAIAEINATVDTALADIRLDELLAADSDIDGAAPPTVGSVFHELMTKTTGSFTYDQTTDSLEAIKDNQTTNFGTIVSDTGNIHDHVRGLSTFVDGIGATGNTTTTIHLPTLTFADDEINNQICCIYDLSEDEYHWRWITDWVNSTKLATVATLPFTPVASDDKFWLIFNRQDVSGGSGLDAAGVRAAIGLASANLDTQLDALPTASENATAVWASGTRTLTALDEDSTTLDLDATIRAAVGMASANLDTQLDALPTAAENTTAVWAAGTRTLTTTFPTNFGSMVISAGGVVSADAVAVSGDTTAADNLESYLDGTHFMPVDAHKPVFSISGATLTVKRPDGTTTAYTRTLTTNASADPVTGSS